MALRNSDTGDPEIGFELLENLLSDVNGVQQQVLKEIVNENGGGGYI